MVDVVVDAMVAESGALERCFVANHIAHIRSRKGHFQLLSSTPPLLAHFIYVCAR